MGKSKAMRSDLVPVSPPPFASCMFDAKFEAEVVDLAKQTVRVEIYWPDPHRRSGNLLGACELSARQLVASKDFRWLTVLDSDGAAVEGVGGEYCKLQLTGELVAPTDNVEKLMEEARASKAISQVLGAQDAVGVSIVLDEDYEKTVGPTIVAHTTGTMNRDHNTRTEFARELRLDLAAALHASDDRFVVCGLHPGSVVAHVNILPDLSGVDARQPRALAKLLANQAADPASPLHYAKTTRRCTSVALAPPFPAPPGQAGGAGPQEAAGQSRRELAPRERVGRQGAEGEEEGGRGRGEREGGPVLGRPQRGLSEQQRQGASLSSLAAGMLRSKEPGAVGVAGFGVAMLHRRRIRRWRCPCRRLECGCVWIGCQPVCGCLRMCQPICVCLVSVS